MKVSVLVITYNHEDYIAQALESALTQRTNFEFEIVVGEDCSTDQTRNIISSYQLQYPERIRILASESNLGMNRNLIRTYQACTGQYIAFLEGDDYWTSPDKLQKQVEFLDAHPECVLCFHKVKLVFQDGIRPPQITEPNKKKDFYTLEDLLLGNFIPNCTVMVRNGLVETVPDWFFSLDIGDWPFHILHSQHGKIGYLDGLEAVYRVHSGGVWSGESSVYRVHRLINVIEQLIDFFGERYQKTLIATLSKLYFHQASAYANYGDVKNARTYLLKSITKYPFNPYIRPVDLGAIFARLYLPIFYTFLKWMWLELQHARELEI